MTPEHEFFLEREAGCLGHSSAPPRGWTPFPHLCISVTRWPSENHGSPGRGAILPEHGHVKATEKAGALLVWACQSDAEHWQKETQEQASKRSSQTVPSHIFFPLSTVAIMLLLLFSP